MKHSIGLWMDSKLQQRIICFEKTITTNDYKLRSIYESLYTDPRKALNQTRANLEKVLKLFLKNQENLELTDRNGRELDLNGLIDILPKANKTFQLRLEGATLSEPINELSQKLNYEKEKLKENMADVISRLTKTQAHLLRVFGNSGSHSGEIEEDELREKAFMAFLIFFHIYNILNDNYQEKDECINLETFLKNNIQVIYETKDDVEEWAKIKFNKLKFNYDLYQINVLNKKPVLDKIIQKERERSSSKNIYFLNLKNYKNFKEMYQDLEDIEEKDYFKIKEKIIDIDTIDMIPLQLLPKDENNPYKWDMCYINLSIEFDDFGVDLILFLNFNQEKFNSTIENYDLTLMSLDSEAQEQS